LIEVDLRNIRLTLPVESKNSLGFTAPTCERLRIAGSFAAAFLGAGWIWPLISLLSEREGHEMAKNPGRVDKIGWLYVLINCYPEVEPNGGSLQCLDYR
jgi:hypothetical protein